MAIVRLREARTEDLPVIRRIYRATLSRWFFTHKEQHTRAIGRRRIIVAEYRGKVVGYIVLSLKNPVKIQELAVLPEFQGRSVGKALVLHVLARFNPVEVETSEAVGFYVKLGFKPVSERISPKLRKRMVRLRYGVIKEVFGDKGI